MARKKPKPSHRKSAKPRKTVSRNLVKITNKSYGRDLRGVRIFFEGQRPKGLKTDGSIVMGKHILETCASRFPRFQWIITKDTDEIKTERGIVRVRTSQRLLRRMSQENWDRARDIKHDIVQRFFSIAFPAHFTDTKANTYVPGSLARILTPAIMPRLSGEDKESITGFLPTFLAAEATSAVKELNAEAQIRTLEGLAESLKTEIARAHTESWWQTYIKANILFMQQGYIKAIEKLNVAVGDTRFPDCCLVSHDNYLDILEIKKPDTPTLKLDDSRGNYYWDKEVAKAISQTANYIEQVATKAASVRSYLLDNEQIDVKAVRPRGIILVGNTARFTEQKQRDDFRLLSLGIKSLTIVTYDELLARLQNFINVLRCT